MTALEDLPSNPSVWALWAPFVMVIPRLVMLFHFRSLLTQRPPTAEMAPDSHRAHYSTLAGLSFTGVCAFAVVDMSTDTHLSISTYYFLISFLSLMLAMNVQGYKTLRWHDIGATGAYDVGAFCIVAAITHVLRTPPMPNELRLVCWGMFCYTITTV